MGQEPAPAPAWPVDAGGDARMEVSTGRGSPPGDGHPWPRSATMCDVPLPDVPPAPVPDVLLALDEEYAQILALLDRGAAMQRTIATVPESAGLHVAWMGEPNGQDEVVLRHTVNATTDQVVRLVVPAGTCLCGHA